MGARSPAATPPTNLAESRDRVYDTSNYRTELSGRTVVITGGNGGIGLALGEGVGRGGAAVVVWGRNPEKNATAVDHLADQGISASSVVCDVSSEDQVSEAMAETVERHGRVDAMFANAGVSGDETSFADLSLAEWRAVTSINLDGTFLTLRAGARQMIHQGGGGALVAVSSIVSRFGAARRAPYGSTKPAVEGLIRSIAVELAVEGIRCNALAPGWTETDLISSSGSFGSGRYEQFRNATVRRTPARRWGRSDDFLAVARFLADPTLSFHTGDVIVLDGGYSIS